VLLSDDVLTIRGEKKQEKEESTGDYYRMERTYGRFERAIPLPENVDPAGIEAKFKKGVLSIQMPQRAELEDKAKKIEIKAE
jgi:HSP20 family protein